MCLKELVPGRTLYIILGTDFIKRHNIITELYLVQVHKTYMHLLFPKSWSWELKRAFPNIPSPKTQLAALDWD